MKFSKLYEMVCADVGIGGTVDVPGTMSQDSYATGDARIPSVLATGKPVIGKKKNKKGKIPYQRRSKFY